jgi:hypothetical protein
LPQLNKTVSSAEETAKYAELIAPIADDVTLIALQAWNETTPLKFVQIGFYPIGGAGIENYPLNTIIQPTIRIPCFWFGSVKLKGMESLFATFRDVVVGDKLVFRWFLL